MEHVGGLDVGWMTHGTPKDSRQRRSNSASASVSAKAAASDSTPKKGSPEPQTPTPISTPKTGSDGASDPLNGASSTTRRPGFGRSNSGSDKTAGAQNGTSPQRRNSWLSSVASKFSSSPQSGDSPTQKQPPSPTSRVASLSPASKPDGEAPYTPCPPKTGQSGIFGVLRRLSSSSGVLGNGIRGTHGLVERRTLNVDSERDRCPIAELNSSKLRKVSFCVDVEIAPMPKYGDHPSASNRLIDKTQKRKLVEKGEGEALKNPKVVEEQKEQDGVIESSGEHVAREPSFEGSEAASIADGASDSPFAAQEPNKGSTASSKKKEKKKKSEEERKARKEKKRRLQEANGTVPMEIRCNSTDSSRPSTPNSTSTTKAAHFSSTNPVRIYRRCCQLRETPILKKVTEQLSDANNLSPETGIVYKLDLTGYWLQLEDLRTLGDYLAVVPVRKLMMENCSITDEGLRYILAGLLAAKRPGVKRRRGGSAIHRLSGGVVENLILKNNNIGVEGWKHVCLFVYMCRSLKSLDLSSIAFPQPASPEGSLGGSPEQDRSAADMALLLSRCLGERLGGPSLELLNLSETYLTSKQLGVITSSLVKGNLRRLGLANNQLDASGVAHAARFLAAGKCEGLDLGGNDLSESVGKIAGALTAKHPLWALSLANCNLKTSSLAKILPVLTTLQDFRFLDLSHNHDLFQSDPSAVAMLRRYLPKMKMLKRIHFANVSMTYEQAIAIIEILPDISGLAHIQLLENQALVKLADAKTAAEQEEACAFYASLLTATRLSKTMVCVDVEVPSERSSELVKAMAKQVVAYCLRNMERFPVDDIGIAVAAALAGEGPQTPYPNVLTHLVDQTEHEEEHEPDEHYVMGGTGVVKALTCCLDNKGDESRRPSAEMHREGSELPSPVSAPNTKITAGKAKETSKHLLWSARKIRARLQPGLAKAKSDTEGDDESLRKLMFLDQTLQGIIKRFEDEYPETREARSESSIQTTAATPPETVASQATEATEVTEATVVSDGEENDLQIKPISRTSSALSQTSRAHVAEEARVHRAGHRFRASIIKPEHFDFLAGDDLGEETRHVEWLQDLLQDLGPEVRDLVREKGVGRTAREHRDLVREKLQEADPDHWKLFAESQEKARANVRVGDGEGEEAAKKGGESAVEDD